jgi:hypothetical protein
VLLNGLATSAMLVTFTLLLVLVGVPSAYLAFAWAGDHNLPVFIQHAAAALGAILGPVIIYGRIFDWLWPNAGAAKEGEAGPNSDQ